MRAIIHGEGLLTGLNAIVTTPTEHIAIVQETIVVIKSMGV